MQCVCVCALSHVTAAVPNPGTENLKKDTFPMLTLLTRSDWIWCTESTESASVPMRVCMFSQTGIRNCWSHSAVRNKLGMKHDCLMLKRELDQKEIYGGMFLSAVTTPWYQSLKTKPFLWSIKNVLGTFDRRGRLRSFHFWPNYPFKPGQLKATVALQSAACNPIAPIS